MMRIMIYFILSIFLLSSCAEDPKVKGEKQLRKLEADIQATLQGILDENPDADVLRTYNAVYQHFPDDEQNSNLELRYDSEWMVRNHYDPENPYLQSTATQLPVNTLVYLTSDPNFVAVKLDNTVLYYERIPLKDG